jgi:hypothetical protein
MEAGINSMDRAGVQSSHQHSREGLQEPLMLAIRSGTTSAALVMKPLIILLHMLLFLLAMAGAGRGLRAAAALL